MSNPVYELARINLKAGVSEQDLSNASDKFQAEFLSSQPGFMGRSLTRDANGAYFDLVHWESMADAEAVMEKAMHSEACGAYFALMDMDGVDPSAGVTHYQSIRHYTL